MTDNSFLTLNDIIPDIEGTKKENVDYSDIDHKIWFIRSNSRTVFTLYPSKYIWAKSYSPTFEKPFSKKTVIPTVVISTSDEDGQKEDISAWDGCISGLVLPPTVAQMMITAIKQAASTEDEYSDPKNVLWQGAEEPVHPIILTTTGKGAGNKTYSITVAPKPLTEKDHESVKSVIEGVQWNPETFFSNTAYFGIFPSDMSDEDCITQYTKARSKSNTEESEKDEKPFPTDDTGELDFDY